MATMEAFESTLKDVVGAKRLSARKVTELTEIALKLMESDTQMVSTLYRTHKSLPASAKVSSLYAFDALCRAARHQVSKNNLTGDINQPIGNSATFLLKIEGILDGLVQDMLTCGAPEAKEKTKKILDIWTKSNTFPTEVLTRLTELAKANLSGAVDKKETPPNRPHASSTSSTDPRKQMAPTGVTPPPVPSASSTPPTAESAQAALLALLTSAAAASNTTNSQTPPNIPPIPTTAVQQPQPQLDPLQLALLQQLANKASAVNAPPPGPSQFAQEFSKNSIPDLNIPQNRQRSPLQAPYRRSEVRDSRYGDDFDRNHSSRDYYDDRRDSYRGAGPSRGGGFRGRGRGRDDYRGGRFDHDERDRSWDWEGDHRGGPRRRYSRSRSPPTKGRFPGSGPGPVPGHRDIKPYSPPRRSAFTATDTDARDRGAGRQTQSAVPGLDEFGRELRPASEEPDPQKDSNEEGSKTSRTDEVKSPTPPTDSESMKESPPPEDAKPTQATSSSGSPEGLDTFDLSTFNPMDPASWKALGEAFQVTNGYLPSQEEMMQLIAGPMLAQAAAVTGQGAAQDQWGQDPEVAGYPQYSQGGRGARGGFRGGRGRGRGGGGGGGDYGNAIEQQQNWSSSVFYEQNSSYNQSTDAVILGGGDEYASQDLGSAPFADHENQESIPDPATSPSGNTTGELDRTPGASGQMQKVEGRWIFVKNAAPS